MNQQSNNYSTITFDLEEIFSMDVEKSRYPFCIVWTPIPLLTWIFPFIGHMGIAYSNGIIRDFAGPYYVSEDEMTFGKPTRYWQLSPTFVQGGKDVWDRAVMDASDVYKTRMHNLLCDNCHSHVALALNKMNYKEKNWNMVKLAFGALFFGKFVSFGGFLKTWLPFLILISCAVTMGILLP